MEMNTKDVEIFQRVVLAGMKLMFSEQTFPILKNGLTKENVPLPQRLAMETAGVFKMLMEKSGGKIPMQLIAPVGLMLLMEMGKFAADAGIAKPSEKDIQQASAILFKHLHTTYAGAQQPATAQPAPAQPAGIMQGV